jgi:hypothetical protein
MSLDEQFERYVDPGAVGRILLCIATPPNRREKPVPDDLTGLFDFWFDGGAARMITGWTQYEFADGTRARVDVTPRLSVVIQFQDGCCVSVKQSTSGLDIGF